MHGILRKILKPKFIYIYFNEKGTKSAQHHQIPASFDVKPFLIPMLYDCIFLRDSIIRSKQVIKDGPALTYLASFIYKDTSLALPKNTMNFWDYNPFQAWVFPGLFSEIVWKGLSFDKIGVDGNENKLSALQQKAVTLLLARFNFSVTLW